MTLWKKLAAGLIAAALAVTSSAALFSASADNTVLNAAAVSAVSLSASELAARTSVDYGYKDLAKRSNGAARQKFYKQLYDFAVDFWDSDSTVTEVYDGDYILNVFEFSGISSEEAIETYLSLRNDCPMFYFYSGNMLRTSKTLWVCLDKDFVTRSQREAFQTKLIQYLDNAGQQVSGLGTAFEKCLRVNDMLVGSVSYATDSSGSPESSPWAHSIVGAVTKGKGVCETYAKTAQMLINYTGGESIMVIGTANGGSHAWNLIKMDDGKYYNMDVTWNDTTSGNIYFASGSTSFNKNHTAYTSSNVREKFLYDLPAVPSADYIPSKFAALLKNYTYYVEGSKAIITAYKGSETKVVIPDEMFGFKVKEIGTGAFYGCKGITSVTLPAYCEKIGRYAFSMDGKLTTVNFNQGLKEIGSDAFYDEVNLKDIVLPNGLEKISSGAFFNCMYYGSREISIPYSVKSIGQYAIGYGYGAGGGSYGFDGDYSGISKTKLLNFKITCYYNTEGYDYATENGFSKSVLMHNVHTYKDTVVPPTYESGGYTVHVCEICGKVVIDSQTERLYRIEDVDRNGVFDRRDCELVITYLMGGLPDADETRFDMNGDGEVTMVDHGLMRAALAGLEVHFG